MSFLSPQGAAAQGGPAGRFTLQRPVSIAIYNSYQDAQHAVDYLADQRFPVQNLSIVGTDLKSFERITGGLTWGKVLTSSAMTGVVWGIMASLFLWLFIPNVNPFLMLVSSLVIFVAANMITSAIGYRMTGGRRDFTSTTQIIATHYEVLGEAEVAGQARAMLSGGQNRGASGGQHYGAAGQQPYGAGQQAGQPGPTGSQQAPATTGSGSFPPPAWPAPTSQSGTTPTQSGTSQGYPSQQSPAAAGQSPARGVVEQPTNGGSTPGEGTPGAQGSDQPPASSAGTFDPTGGRD